MKKCREINELMSLYIDNQLDDSACTEFEKHINACDSCREELNRLIKVIELCRNVDEIELPEGFREELHQKLVAEKEKLYKQYRGTNLLNKYVKICSTIAACLILSFFAGRFIANNYFLPAKHDESRQSAELTSMQQHDAAGAAENAALNVESFSETEEEMTFSIAVDDGNQLSGEEIPDTSRHTNANERSSGAMLLNTVPVNNKNINIKFKVNNIADAQAQIERIEEFAINNGAEISDYISPCFVEGKYDEMTKEAVDIDVTAKANVLYLKVQDDKYGEFIDLLKSNFSNLNIEVGDLETKDCTEIFDELNTQLQVLDKRIEELEKRKEVSDPDELNRLKRERKVIWDKMERLQLDSNYTFITVELRTE
ncbi:MAG TPA: hypothetical protein GXX14_10760 [Clostridiaceae bacterium]|nr:hypothetical protein [Clostridiaceae bacterium]